MNTIKKAALLLIVTLVISGGFAEAQITISKDKSGKARTFLAGKLSLARDIDSLETKSFVCKLVTPLKKGDICQWESKSVPIMGK